MANLPHITQESSGLTSFLLTARNYPNREPQMTQLPQIRAERRANKAFDAETTRVLGSAFDAAWERVEATSLLPTDEGQVASMREVLAKFLIATVEQGERDPNRLIEKAVLRLGIILRPEVGVRANAEKSSVGSYGNSGPIP
jgi:hypothetical protein